MSSIEGSLGAALRRAWVGYQRRLDAEMAAAGFAGRGFPDGRVLRLCLRSDTVTAARIGRELGISRQAAGKIVAGLRRRGFVALSPSSDDAREKVVTLTPRANAYLAAQRAAARRIEREVHEGLGEDPFAVLQALLETLGASGGPTRMREYLQSTLRPGDDDDAV